MSRFRSSFDLTGAIASANSLDGTEEREVPSYRGVSLISFAAPASVRAPQASERSAAIARGVPAAEGPTIEEGGPTDSARRPPKLPDLSALTSAVARCGKIVEWVAEATGASNVFLSDGTGLPIAGAVEDADAKIASAGMVATAIAQLAQSLPGTTSSIFEMHIGEGPFFQLIGFRVSGALYLVGLTRATPLLPRQAHAVRLACKHALGEPQAGAV